jgi:hypothetical protein
MPDRATLARGLFVRMSPRTHKALKVRAAEEERTMAEVVESAVVMYLKAPAGWAPRLRKRKR